MMPSLRPIGVDAAFPLAVKLGVATVGARDDRVLLAFGADLENNPGR
jgi:hypothetical protein